VGQDSAVGETAPRPASTSRAISAWAKRQCDNLIRDALVGLVVLGVGLIFAAWWDSRLADRQNQLARDLATASEVQENIRFVRQVAIDDAAVKPFAGLNLRGATLAGLDVSCEDIAANTGCADFAGAVLSDADLAMVKLAGAMLDKAKLTRVDLHLADLTSARLLAANLNGALLFDVNLSGAHLAEANLSSTNLTLSDLRDADLRAADLTHADVRGANLTDANLRGADLRGTDLAVAALRGADLAHVCYDDTTTWPDGFTPARTRLRLVPDRSLKGSVDSRTAHEVINQWHAAGMAADGLTLALEDYQRAPRTSSSRRGTGSRARLRVRRCPA
jgi:uncharacterized protein YjbI with pentapeptide repeats